MDELVMTIEESGCTYSWWFGSGSWWLAIEGLGGFFYSTPTQTEGE